MSESGERVPYKQGGVSLALGKRFEVQLPAAVLRARLTGLLFDTSKSFLLPSAIHGMRALKRLFDEHKNLSILVTGHTDRAGSDDYNVTLSNERAQSMSAYLRDAVDEWMKFYGQGVSQEKRWGAREDSLMIGQVVPADKLADPGTPPPASAGNVKAFQEFSNQTRGTSLPTDGKITQQTRQELVAAYMKQPDTTLPGGVVPLTHGCGPFHNEVPTGPGVAEQRNRRAEIFFFDGPVKPPPRKPCPGPKGCPEYPEWVKRTNKTIDLDRGVGTLTVQVQDQGGAAIEGASVHVEGPFSEDGKTDGKGTAPFADMPAGSYKVSAAHPGFEGGETSAVLADGAQAKATLSLKATAPAADTVIVTVLTPGGELLNGATVTLERGTDHREDKTGASGETPPFKDVPLGKWKVSARLDNFTAPAPEEIEVKGGAGQKKTITLTPAAATPVIGATAPVTLPLLVVKKKGPCTPARKPITLSVKGTFTGSGTGRFTRSKDTVKFFTAAAAGAEITFNGTDNVFTAAELTAGKQLFAEGATTSSALEDTELKLELLAGSNAVGTPATAKATCLELTVDLFQSRTARAGDPAKVAEADKAAKGRFVHVQDASFNQGRAMLVVREVQPAGFTGSLKLQRQGAGAGAVQLFPKEFHEAGEADQLPATLTPAQLGAQQVAGAKGFALFAEGKTPSGALHDITLQLGIDGDEPDGDRIALTAVRFSNLQAVVPSTPSPRTGAVADHPAFVISGGSPDHFSEDFALNPPLVLLQNSIEAGTPVKLSVTVEPAGVPVSWSALRDTRPKQAAVAAHANDGDAPGVVALSPKPVPTVASTGATTGTLLTDAVGSFRVRAFVNGNSTADFDRDPGTTDSFSPDPFILLNLVLAHVRLDRDDVQAHQTLRAVPNAGGIFASSGVFDVVNQPNNTALHHNALCTIIGGGRNGRLGTDRVFGGWMQDAVAAIGHRGTYLDNTAAPPAAHPMPTVQENPRRGAFPPTTTPDILPADPAAAIFPTPPPLLDSGRSPAGEGGLTACLGQSRATSRNNAALGEQLRIQAVDSPAMPYPANHPGFAAARLTFFHFEMRFRAALSFWTNNHSPPNGNKSGDPAERLYVVALEVPWNMLGEWDVNPGTGAVTVHGAAPAVTLPGNTRHTPAVSAQSLGMEPTIATGQSTWLGTWIHDAQH
ncbi:MAG TPA: carboxypeptidase regulatory-like domain-containing protein [Myxococcales bacterium]|nr:carboxypeptidase regulatory-like domain-containing protein [Myxococcales bacterium]